MTIFQKLRLRSLQKSLLYIIPPLILAALMTMIAIPGFRDMNREPVELYSIPRDELEGAYVTVEIPLIYDAYAYSEETVNDIPTGKITSKEYIIDANETDFCGLVLADELIEQGDQLYSDSMKYLTGRLSDVNSTFRVTGVMRAIIGTRLEYYRSSAVSELLGAAAAVLSGRGNKTRSQRPFPGAGHCPYITGSLCTSHGSAAERRLSEAADSHGFRADAR